MSKVISGMRTEKEPELKKWKALDQRAVREVGRNEEVPHRHHARQTREILRSVKMKIEGNIYGQLIGCYRNEKDRFGANVDEHWSKIIPDGESHTERLDFNQRRNVRSFQ